MSAVTAMAKATAAEMETATCKNAAALPNYSLMLQPTLQLWLPLSLPPPSAASFCGLLGVCESVCVCVCAALINLKLAAVRSFDLPYIAVCIWRIRCCSRCFVLPPPPTHTHTAHSYALQTVIWLFDPT